MSSIPHNISDRTITVFLDEGPITVDRNSHVEAELRDVLAQDDPDLTRLRTLLSPGAALNEALEGTGVELVGNIVTYKGKAITGHIAKRFLDLVANGHNIKPWQRFVQKVYANPLDSVREELALFLEHADLPITDDGCFLAYKRVNTDYTDCHTSTMDNSVGQIVTMPGGRADVDPNRHNHCSRGLHFCSKAYLANFRKGRGKIVVVKIDPADVVAIPADYGNTKGRAWKYEVVGEIDTDDDATAKEWGILNREYTPVVTEDPDEAIEWDDTALEDVLEEVELPAPVETVPTAWVAPSPARKSFWKSAKDYLRGV